MRAVKDGRQDGANVLLAAGANVDDKDQVNV